MDKQVEKQLIALLDELLENGDFYASAIESKSYEFDFEEWKVRAVKLLNEAKSQE